MSMTTHLETLMVKHAKLESELEDAYLNHLPDETIQQLKKQKLRMKEEIVSLQKKCELMEGTYSSRVAA